MTAFNIVRFRVKTGCEEAFVNEHRGMKADFAEMRRLLLIRTGERAYCLIGEWDSMAGIVRARPGMIARLDRIRSLLEDLGGGLGVTDAVSGDAVLESTA